jgi:hypothetical protein
MLMQSPFAPQLTSIGDMAEVFPRASEDTHWTWNCIDMDGVAACYGVLNTQRSPGPYALHIAICAAAGSCPRHSANINCMTWMLLMPIATEEEYSYY